MKTPPEEITYVDPEEEEADWIPPPLPDPADLDDNTDEWKFFYRWKGRAPKRAWPVAIGITREICAPWRRGLGISFSAARRRTTVGIWWRGEEPQWNIEPRQVSLRKALKRARKYARTEKSST